MGRPAEFRFIGGSLDGLRAERLLDDGSAPSDFRVLLDGPVPRAPRRYDDGYRREWDVYRRDGSDDAGRPLFRHQGRQITGAS